MNILKNELNYWKNKKVFITGVAGTIGSNILAKLSKIESISIIGIDIIESKINELSKKYKYENINYNILHLDEFTNSYPYLIEDVGMSFIMYMNNVKFTHSDIFFDKPNSICKHTNKYK